MPRAARQTLILLALAGCRFDADYGGTQLRCPPESPDCPDGFTCVAQVCTASPPDGGGGPDASTCELAAQAAPNDVCGAAIDLTTAALAAGGTIAYGNTTGYASDLTPTSLPGCTGFQEPGPDAIYVLTLAAGDTVLLTLSPEGWSGDVYLIDACNSQTAVCEGGAAQFAQASIPITAAGTYFIVVDARTAGTGGCFRLAATIMR